MGILDRILLLLCIVTFALLMLSTVLAAFTIVPLEWLDDALALLYGHWEAAAVAAIFFLASVRLLFTGMTSGEPRDTMLCQTENGQVRVAISAVRSLVERTARQIKGVKQTKIRLENSRQGMNIYLRIVVLPDLIVPELTAELQQRVRSTLQETLLAEVHDIQVLVEEIAAEGKVRARVE